MGEHLSKGKDFSTSEPLVAKEGLNFKDRKFFSCYKECDGILRTIILFIVINARISILLKNNKIFTQL
jgi:hypothetical protein